MKKYLPLLSGGLVLSLLLAACGSTPVPTVPDPISAADQASVADQPSAVDPLLTTLALSSVPLTDRAWISAVNGLGPAELNLSNGGAAAGDGRTLSLRGQTYAKGLGVHAASSVKYDVTGCSQFQSDIGVDDEVGGLGLVTFEVWADGVRLYKSGRLTGKSAKVSVNVSIAGRKALTLVVTDGGNGVDQDHGDWAGATLIGCPVVAPAPAPVPAPAPAPAPVFSGPITITQGGTYSGNWESTDPAVPAVSIQTSQPVVIENSRIRGVGHNGLIEGYGSDLTVRGSIFTGIRPNVRGVAAPRALCLGDVHNLRFEHNLISHTGGVYLNNYRGDGTAANTVTIRYNRSLNTDGRQSDGVGGILAGAQTIANFVQFNQLQGLPGADISWNEVRDEAYNSLAEDKINMYLSSGTATSPIRIHDNLIRGAYSQNPATDASYSGGGIILGDGTSTALEQNAHAWAYDNTVLDTVNYGVSIAGGSDMRLQRNVVLSSGLLPDGRRIPAQNVGLIVWNYSSVAPALMQNNLEEDSTLAWAHWNVDGSAGSNAWWTPDCSALYTSVCRNNTFPAVPTPADIGTADQNWQSRLAAQGLTTGSSLP